MANMGERWMAEALAGLQKYPCIGAKLYRGQRVEGKGLAERFAEVSENFLRPMAKHVREIRVFRRWPAKRENGDFSRMLIRSGRTLSLDIGQADAFDSGVVWRGASDTGLMPIFVLDEGILHEPSFVSSLNMPRPLRNPGVMVGTSGLKFARGAHFPEGGVRISPCLSVYADPELLVFAQPQTITKIFVSAIERSDD